MLGDRSASRIDQKRGGSFSLDLFLCISPQGIEYDALVRIIEDGSNFGHI